MLTCVSNQPFQKTGQVNQRTHFLFIFVTAAELFFLLQGFIQGDTQIHRDQFGQGIDKTIGMGQHPSGITDHRLGCHGAVGDDLRHPIATVTPSDIVDHPVTTIHTEIDIEIRQRNPFGIQKPFKK